MHYDRYKSNRSACIRITDKFLSCKHQVSDIDTLQVLDLNLRQSIYVYKDHMQDTKCKMYKK